MENREIRQHPLGFPNPDDVLVFQSVTDLKTYRTPAGQFIPSPTTNNIEWTSAAAVAGDYDIDSIVTHEGNIYQSIIDNNPNIPGSDDSWTLLTKGKSGFVMWQASTFLEDEVFTLFKIAPFNHVYIFRLSDGTPRPYVSVDFMDELQAGDWELVAKVPLIVLDTTPGDLTLNAYFIQDLDYKGSAQIVGDKNVLFSQLPTNGKITFRFDIDQDIKLIFIEPDEDPNPNVRLANAYNANWNEVTKEWSALENGSYEMYVTNMSGVINLRIEGPFK